MTLHLFIFLLSLSASLGLAAFVKRMHISSEANLIIYKNICIQSWSLYFSYSGIIIRGSCFVFLPFFLLSLHFAFAFICIGNIVVCLIVRRNTKLPHVFKKKLEENAAGCRDAPGTGKVIKVGKRMLLLHPKWRWDSVVVLAYITRTCLSLSLALWEYGCLNIR